MRSTNQQRDRSPCGRDTNIVSDVRKKGKFSTMSKRKRTPSGAYAQNWPVYRAARVNEKRYFPWLLKELCQEIEEPEQSTGRKPFSLKDMVFSSISKVYSTFSSCRFQPDLQDAQAKKLIQQAPTANTLSGYLRNEKLTTALQTLITKSSLPLAKNENVFAVDSTALSAPHKRFWFNRHTGRRERRRDYVKLHVMCGVNSNVITSAEVSEGTANDSPYFKQLVERTARYFEISEVSADAAYISSNNRRVVILAGGIPYIAFRRNSSLDAAYKSTHWKEMLYLFKNRQPEFTEHYNLRNNVEATFSAVKAKHDHRLRSKSPRGQINEALCKVICHNICVLIQSMYELKIDPTSWSGAKLTPMATSGSISRALTEREADLVAIRIAAADQERLVRQGSVEEEEYIAGAENALVSNQILLFE
jgi:hypothetical protein